ncbi:MAG: hypothetical protein ACK4XK_10840 [Casimicrobiaceae bacterium]
MSSRFFLVLSLAAGVASTLAAATAREPAAAGAPSERRAARLEAPAAPPALPQPIGFAYRSVLDAYRRLSEVPVGSWREANDTVARIGGWRAYAAEAQAAESDRSASPSPPGTPSRTPGHEHRGQR